MTNRTGVDARPALSHAPAVRLAGHVGGHLLETSRLRECPRPARHRRAFDRVHPSPASACVVTCPEPARTDIISPPVHRELWITKTEGHHPHLHEPSTQGLPRACAWPFGNDISTPYLPVLSTPTDFTRGSGNAAQRSLAAGFLKRQTAMVTYIFLIRATRCYLSRSR